MKERKIFKQFFWFSIINYVGVFMGVVSTVFIYPYNKEFLGVIRYVDSIAQLLYPFLLLGGAQALIHFNPLLKEQNKEQLLKFSIVSILSISFLVLIIVYLGGLFSAWENYKYLYYAFPLGIVLAFVELFKRHAINIGKFEIPTLYEKIIPKIALPTIFGFMILGYFNNVNALRYYIIAYVILLLLICYYLFRNYKWKWGVDLKSLFSKIPRSVYYRYCLFSLLGSFGSILAFRIDALMIPEFLSFEANGTFSIGMALATSMAIPATGLFAIYAPKISIYLKNNQIEELGKKYKETAKLLFFIGAVLYTSIVLGIESLFSILPAYDKLVDAIPIIILLGANVLFNMSTGFNNEIISYSKYYKFNILFVFLLAIFNIVLNTYFLTQTELGIIGVAIASFIAMVTFNCLKLLFIYKKLEILPFDKSYFKLIIIVSLVFFTFYLMPDYPNTLINLILKIGLNILLIFAITYKLKLIHSLNYWFSKLYKS